MKRSFVGNRGMGKAVGRAVASGGRVTTPPSNNTTSNKPKHVSSFNSPTSPSSSQLTLLANPWGRHSSSTSSPPCYFNDGGDVWEWEYVDGEEEVEGFYEDRFVFGTVPVRDEVETALSSLQQILAPASFSQFIEDGLLSGSEQDATTPISGPPSLLLRRVSSAGSATDWMEPSMQLYNPNTMQSFGGEMVYDAFHLLQTEPSVQRAVVSLSTDKAVWDAVMNNEVIKELREVYAAAASETSSTESSVAAKSVVSWILDSSKAKLMELMNKLSQLFAEVFQPPNKKSEETTAKDEFDGILSCSVLLSIVVLLIVVMTRAHNA